MSRQKSLALDKEAQMIAALEAGGYVSIDNEAAEVQRYTELFRENGAKVKRVNIRMTTRDVEKAQAIALREGVPYATLLTSILHQYFTGQLKKVSSS